MNPNSRFTAGLDNRFLSHIILHSSLAALVIGGILLGMGSRLPERAGWGFLASALCGIVNLYLLKRVIEALVRPTGKRPVDAILSVIGLHVVVGGFLYTIYARLFPLPFMIAGFSLVLAVVVLKAVASAFNPKGE